MILKRIGLVILFSSIARVGFSQPVTALQPASASLSLNANNTAAPQTGTVYAIPQSCNTISWIISFATQPASVNTNLELSNDNVTYEVTDSSTNVLGESRTVFTAARFIRTTETARSGGSAITTSLVCKNSPTAAVTIPGTFNIPLVLNGTNLGTTSTTGLSLNNTTLATAGVPVQISPRVRFCGNAYNSVSTLSEVNCFFLEDLPVTAAGTTSGMLKIGYTSPSSVTTYPFTFTNGGTLTTLGSIVASANVSVPNTFFFFWATNSALGSPADGQLNLTNNATSIGVGLNFGTDGVLSVRTRAQTGDASIKAGVFVSAGAGMAVANVGANSCGTTAATIAGNANAFVITVGATSGTQCRVAFPVAATTEYDCVPAQETSGLTIGVTPVDSTHTDFLGTFSAGAKIIGVCFAR